MSALKIHEIFHSIQGESTFVGKPTVFVRTSACNLRCTYCDTAYAFGRGTLMEIDEILAHVAKYPVRHVCVTGGEPLGQKGTVELLARLVDKGYVVSLETNGSFSVKEVPAGVVKVVDIKCPESGESEAMCWENLELTRSPDQFKFVVASRADFDWSRALCEKHALWDRAEVLFSPSFGDVEPKDLAAWILETGMPVTFQMQLHKAIWAPEARGV